MWKNCSIVQRQQLAGSNQIYEIDVSARAVNAWVAHAEFAAGALIRPTDSNQNGFVFRSSGAGQTGALEPAWPTTVGGTVTDGSITWTAQAPPASGEDTVASATWTQASPPDATLTITSQSTSSLVASALIGGGTSGNVYLVQVAVTMASGAIYVVQIYITTL